MLGERERVEIEGLWGRKLRQDALGLPQAERHRNLDPDGAEPIVADHIISHSLTSHAAHVRSQLGVESITLPIGKGLEVTRL
jgi:hypothetical protein